MKTKLSNFENPEVEDESTNVAKLMESEKGSQDESESVADINDHEYNLVDSDIN